MSGTRCQSLSAAILERSDHGRYTRVQYYSGQVLNFRGTGCFRTLKTVWSRRDEPPPRGPPRPPVAIDARAGLLSSPGCLSVRIPPCSSPAPRAPRLAATAARSATPIPPNSVRAPRRPRSSAPGSPRRTSTKSSSATPGRRDLGRIPARQVGRRAGLADTVPARLSTRRARRVCRLWPSARRRFCSDSRRSCSPAASSR